jgi:hypothetical protein
VKQQRGEVEGDEPADEHRRTDGVSRGAGQDMEPNRHWRWPVVETSCFKLSMENYLLLLVLIHTEFSTSDY